MYPIKDIKEFIMFLGALMGLYPAAKADGKIDLNDLMLLTTLLPTAGPAIEGIGNITKEATDVTVEERAELDQTIDQAFGPGTASEIGEEVLQMAVRIARVLTILKEKKAATPAEGSGTDAAPAS